MTSNPERRFGPVTLLAIAGGVLCGLLGVALAQLSGRPELMRGILVGSIFTGALVGVVAGSVWEHYGVRIRQRISRDWFKFNTRMMLMLLTGVALFLGALVSVQRVLGISWGSPFFGPGSLWTLLWGTPRVVVYLLAILALINRSALHPLASRLALLGIAGWMLTYLANVLVGLWLNSITTISGTPTSEYFELYRWWWIFSNYILDTICLALIFAAILVDREDKSKTEKETQQ